MGEIRSVTRGKREDRSVTPCNKWKIQNTDSVRAPEKRNNAADRVPPPSRSTANKPTLVPDRRNSKRERRERSDKSVRSGGGRERLTAKRRWDGAARFPRRRRKESGRGEAAKGTEEREEIAVREFELLCARFRALLSVMLSCFTRYTRRRRDRRNRRKISAASNRIPFSFRGKLLLNETPLYTSFLCLKIWHKTLRLKIHNLFVATIIWDQLYRMF